MVIAFQSFPVDKRGVQRSSHPRRGLLTVGQAMLLIRSSWVSGAFIDVGLARSDQFVARGAFLDGILSNLNRAD